VFGPTKICGIFQEFSKAKRPVSFFIVLYVFDFVEWHDSSMENATTKEMLDASHQKGGKIQI
jgi:hypothetical protein